MSDGIIQAKITTKPWFENANFRFYPELIPSSHDEKNTHVKTSRRKRRSEKISRKRGLLVTFEHVT